MNFASDSWPALGVNWETTPYGLLKTIVRAGSISLAGLGAPCLLGLGLILPGALHDGLRVRAVDVDLGHGLALEDEDAPGRIAVVQVLEELRGDHGPGRGLRRLVGGFLYRRLVLLQEIVQVLHLA